MKYSVSSRAYLDRAHEALRNGASEHLFYAAFELRCGIEARMNEYLEGWAHVSKKKKNGWRIPEIARNLEETFRLGHKSVRWAVHEEDSGKLLVVFYYTPVGPRLQAAGKKLGNYLHSMKQFRPPEDSWWQTFRSELDAAATDLAKATRGTLLGPPLMKKGTSEVDMKLEIPSATEAEAIHKQIHGQRLRVRVDYLSSIPDELEPEAHVWSKAS